MIFSTTKQNLKNLRKTLPTNLKNKIITADNAEIGSFKPPKIIGDYKPRYIHVKIKIYKPRNPLKPIISQIPAPTHSIAKAINIIQSSYIQNNYSIISATNFI